MSTSEITRRVFLGAAAGLAACRSNDWIELFDGQSLNNWRPSENKDTWKVEGGHLISGGARSHLFYEGPVQNASFRNFELEVEASAAHRCNSGVYFHTAYQEEGWPAKGFEVQINNTATGEGSYNERKKTASLYGVRNNYKQLIGDDEWFTLRVAVRGKNIQVWLNDMVMVNYTEPDPPLFATDNERDRRLDRGTFALQGHDPGSTVRIRSVRVKPLPDDEPAPPDAAATVSGSFGQDILTLGARNVPLVDYHVHLKQDLSLEDALEFSRRWGIQYGIAINGGKDNPAQNDEQALGFLDQLRGHPVFTAMQAEGREWTSMFSTEAARQFDYLFTDSMTWTDDRGKRMRLWIANEVGSINDTRDFMETLVDRTVGILEDEPIDIYVNPTFLPEVIAGEYDRLWTEERMAHVIEAARANQVAIEINNRYELPSKTFLQMAKEAGCKFSWGTNNSGADDLGRCEHAIQMTKELELRRQDFFVPGLWCEKAIDRKPDVLQG